MSIFLFVLDNWPVSYGSTVSLHPSCNLFSKDLSSLEPTCSKESSLPLLTGVMEVGGEGPPELNSRVAPPVHLASHPAKHMSGIEGDKGWTRSAQNTQGFTGWWFWEEEARVCVK